jgi:hypothetical protein
MDGLAIVRVSAAVVGLMFLLRWAGVSQRCAPLLVAVLAAVGVGVWAYAHGPVGQSEIFDYVGGWIAVATSAATVWGFTWVAAGPARPARDARRK